MDITIRPSLLTGTVDAIPSKSYAHRYLICAALASNTGVSTVEIGSASRDILATADCLKSLGALINIENGIYNVCSIEKAKEVPDLHCCQSGSTLRFLAPVASALCGGRFIMEGRLGSRPMDDLLNALAEHGVKFANDGKFLTVGGGMDGGEFKIAGNVSSQYISGILFALPLCGGGRVTLTTRLESRPYVTMTVEAMASFGVEVTEDENGFAVAADQHYKTADAKVPGDWSNAAFWLASGVGVSGLSPNCAQGDRAIIDVMARMGAPVEYKNGVYKADPTVMYGCEIDARNIPDAVPIISVLAGRADGVTRIYNAARLRAKESDRIASTSAMLTALGVKNEQTDDGLIIYGQNKPFKSCTVDCSNDHRIAMSGAVAASYSEGKVTLIGAEAVNKSYPAFFDDYKKLGGDINVQHVG